MKKVAVLIPCYNEEQTIEKVIFDFKKVLPEAKIIVYDNNSTDSSAKLAKQAGATVRFVKKIGKGNVVREMFNKENMDCLLIVDADDTYAAKNAKKMVNLVLNDGYDMVIGDRLSTTYLKENRRTFHNIGNKLVRFLVRKIHGVKVNDVLTGYRAFSKKFVNDFPAHSNGFEVETEMTIFLSNNKYKYIEIPIGYKNRPAGSHSKLRTFRDGAKVLKTVLKRSSK